MFTGESIDENSATPSVSGEILVAVEDVTKRYAQRVAVEKLTLELRTGEVVAQSETKSAREPPASSNNY